MYFLKKGKDGYLYLNAKGRQLINQFYKPPKQHGKKNLQQWQKNASNVHSENDTVTKLHRD